MVKHKTRQLSDTLVGIISSWDGVECITLNEAAMPDTLDPYFALILDVYHSGGIPPVDARRAAYGKMVAAFETSPLHAKDRFLIDGLPVRVELKLTDKIDSQVAIAANPSSSMWSLHRTGTYMFYRLQKGVMLYQKSDWLEGVREKLAALPDSFWEQLRRANESRMEHYVADLGAAVAQGDDFHYLISSAGFIKHACMALFCANCRFEPSHRAYSEQIKELAVLPDDFPGRLDSFLRNDEEMTPERKFSLAQLIARSVMAL